MKRNRTNNKDNNSISSTKTKYITSNVIRALITLSILWIFCLNLCLSWSSHQSRILPLSRLMIEHSQHPSSSVHYSNSGKNTHKYQLGSRRVAPVLLFGKGRNEEQDDFDRRLKDLQSQVSLLQETLKQQKAATDAKSATQSPAIPLPIQQPPLVGSGIYGPYLRYGMYTFPEEERLLLATAAAGVLLGTLLGKLICLPTLGALGGVIFALKYFDRKGAIGQFTRLMGKIAIICVYQASIFIRDFESNWKAWRLYEKVYKQYERMDNRFNITRSFYQWDNKYKFTSTSENIKNQVLGASNFAWKGILKVDDTLRNQIWPRTQQPVANLTSQIQQRMNTLSRHVENQYELSSLEMARAKDSVAKFNEDWASRWSDWMIDMPKWGIGAKRNVTSKVPKKTNGKKVNSAQSEITTIDLTANSTQSNSDSDNNSTNIFLKILGQN
mmetsp:Transcript_28325/g.35560  ORF Transcript_28325/g.35560 Transcript_28325/m.35560 type:complete len:441 (-) Transcript_28325:4-1326(-)